MRPSARIRRPRRSAFRASCNRDSKLPPRSNCGRTNRVGSPAARLTDLHVCPMVTVLVPHVGGPIIAPGAPTVLIGGLPAARVTDMAVCVGPPDVIVLGSFTVLTIAMPQARIGDLTAHGGTIILGEFTVLVGG